MARSSASAARTRRPVSAPGDETGAADLGRRVADNLKERRRVLGWSLDELASASGVSRAALSQIETCKTNPSLSVLWKVAVGLGIPFAELLGNDRDTVSLLRRGEAQALRSPDGKFESRPLARSGAGPGVEVYELRLVGHASYASEPHGPGTRELVTVIGGSLRMTVGPESYLLAAGDSLVFPADQRHVYENPGATEGRYHDVIVYRR
ncbi:MAG TPA: XRE family transcriptional regulator [Polyangia bacterium]|nr:XRE family transcriptional regulator [Polyangia bacterium]